MYFKTLEIFGFKSFADKTVLNFEQGITAIVGPNGCGKSNVFDSIRWVLGEQSIKELRGSVKEDVIFNGTDAKAPLGFAEVSLTFSNEDKALPIEYSEVTVTRRLYRSGESEYLLNKTPVRLKDILELFMGTGIGAEAYSLVQQGKVDLIVSAKPEDRRIIIDEAAGITKYKSKKREAINKLKDTENNLLRINDIIVEVKRQIGSLERQANKARRYKVEFERLKRFEVELTRDQIENSENEKKSISAKMEEFRGSEIKLSNELQECEVLLASQSAALEKLEQSINEINSEDIKLEGQIDINNKQIGFNEERIESLLSNERKLNEKKTQLIERCRVEQEKIEELKKALEDLVVTVESKRGLLEEKKQNLESIERSVEAAKDEINKNEEEIMEITSRQVNVKNSLTEAMKELQGSLARKRRLDIENNKVVSEKETIDDRLKDTCAQIENVSQKVSGMKTSLGEEVEVFNGIKTRISQAHSEVNELEKNRIMLNSQKEFLEKLQVQYQDIPDPVIEGKLITQKPPSECHSGILGKVKEVQYLDSEKCNLFKNGFRNDVGSGQLYEVVCEAKFIELDPEQIINKIEEVSRDIVLKNEEKDGLIRQIEHQEEVIQRSEKELQNEEKALSILRSQKNDITEEVSKLVSELELINFELTEVDETLEQLRKKETELTFNLDSLSQDIGSCQTFIKENRKTITAKLKDRENLTVFIAQLETELESDMEKQNTQQQNLSDFETRIDGELEEIKRIDDESSEFDEKKNSYIAEIEVLKVKIQELREKKQSIKGVLINYEREKEDISQRLNSLRSNREGLEEGIQKVKQDIHSQEMKGQELSFSEKAVKDRLFQSYKIDINETEESMDDEEKEKFPINSNEFQNELERLKKKCESFGSVNLVAIEEFDDLKERYEFLTKQQSDLIESKESLQKTITKINRQTRQMFLETFTKVGEEFRIYFRMLFGGGEANLVLIDPDNVLESGIEIVARPPGKKLQSISLLSGGEKTLTAIALVFGVFKVKPSPFCVLDEIDAALDESNVGRFSYLLKDFAKIAQFIVITHNKKTISSADVLYGVTMQERGVSKMVSVKISDDEKRDVKEEVPVGAG